MSQIFFVTVFTQTVDINTRSENILKSLIVYLGEDVEYLIKEYLVWVSADYVDRMFRLLVVKGAVSGLVVLAFCPLLQYFPSTKCHHICTEDVHFVGSLS